MELTANDVWMSCTSGNGGCLETVEIHVFDGSTTSEVAKTTLSGSITAARTFDWLGVEMSSSTGPPCFGRRASRTPSWRKMT